MPLRSPKNWMYSLVWEKLSDRACKSLFTSQSCGSEMCYFLCSYHQTCLVGCEIPANCKASCNRQKKLHNIWGINRSLSPHDVYFSICYAENNSNEMQPSLTILCCVTSTQQHLHPFLALPRTKLPKNLTTHISKWIARIVSRPVPCCWFVSGNRDGVSLLVHAYLSLYKRTQWC